MSKKLSVSNIGGIVANSINANKVNINNNVSKDKPEYIDEVVHPVFVSFMKEHKSLARFISGLMTNFFPKLSPSFVSSSPDCVPIDSDWFAETERALCNTQVLFVLACKKSLAKPWINFEIGAAWSRKIPIIFLCYQDILPDNLPTPYGSRQALVLSQIALENSLESILNTVETTLSTKRNASFPTAFFVNALREELFAIECINKG